MTSLFADTPQEVSNTTSDALNINQKKILEKSTNKFETDITDTSTFASLVLYIFC
jgi:hypothetical protein